MTDGGFETTQIVVVGDGSLARAVAEAVGHLGEVVRASSGPRDDAAPAFVEGRTFDLLLAADLVVDASGDAATRYLANDAAAVRGIPIVWVDAAAGEVGVGFDEQGVDYRDLHAPDEPATGTSAPSGPLAEAAVELVAAAVAGPSVAGRVLVWDGAAFAEHRFARAADAPRPGSLEERTTIPEPDEAGSITAPQLAKLLAGATTLGVHEPVPTLLDVRDAPEVSFVTLPDAVHIPLAQLPEHLDELVTELGPDAPLVVYCHHGVRSSRALGMLQRAGFTRVRHLTGGIDAYAAQVDPDLPRY